MKRIFISMALIAFLSTTKAQEQTIPGATATGFYDDFESQNEYISPQGFGIHWSVDYQTKASVERMDGYLKATVDQDFAIEWNPLRVSFGKSPNDIPNTIDLSNAAEIKTEITNDNNVDCFVEFSFYLASGKIVQFKSGLDTAPESEIWDYMANFNLPAYTKKEVVIDLTNGMSGDCFWTNDFDRSCVQHEDMSKVVSMTYEIFSLHEPIQDAKFKIHSLKVGSIDGGEQELITSVEENSEENVLSVFPNPASSKLAVSTSGKLRVFSIDGIEIYNQKVEANEPIDIEEWTGGMYVMKVVNEQGEFKTTFVKQ